MQMVKELEDQLQIRTSKLATLEKVLNNTRRHLQDAVENSRETELHYQTKMEEIEQEFDEERVELQEKLQQVSFMTFTLTFHIPLHLLTVYGITFALYYLNANLHMYLSLFLPVCRPLLDIFLPA